MEILTLGVLAVTTAVALTGWRVPGLAQVWFSLLLLAGLTGSAALLAFVGSAVPDGAAEAYDVGVLGVLAIAGGSVLTTSVFRTIDGPDEAEEGSMRQAGEVLRGGAWIGALERVAVFVSVLVGWPSGLAVILAVKGLGRYPELRSETPGAAERFIIGTFTSVLWAIACAGVALLALA